MLTQVVVKEMKVELDGLCAALAADDPEAAEGVRTAGLRAIACAEGDDDAGAAEAYADIVFCVIDFVN